MRWSARTLPKLLSLVCLVLLVLLFFTSRTSKLHDKQQNTPQLPRVTVGTTYPSSSPFTPTTTILGSSESAVFVPVVKVVDGDTVTVLVEGKKETIRLIGINTPETVDPRRMVECFGKEASQYAKKRLTGQQVRLERDPTQADRDKYARLLRYLYFPDGTFFNKEMITEGYAYEYTYNSAYQYQQEFRSAETQAKFEKRGLWSDATCQGQK